ncbi:MAG: tetratricopeptide repeat protein [Myxococcaceae bacterium]
MKSPDEIFRKLPPPRELSPVELARIERRVEERVRQAPRRFAFRNWLLGAALLSSLAFAATYMAIRPTEQKVKQSASSDQSEADWGDERPAEVDTLAAESGLIAHALHELRQEKKPEAALKTLERYQSRFPSGQLKAESQEARVDALLASRRKAEALEELLKIEAPSDELRVLRAELLSELGRPKEALPILDSLLRTPLAPTVEERAWVARATARKAIGQLQGARQDLRRYLERFPAGRFAQAARTSLSR